MVIARIESFIVGKGLKDALKKSRNLLASRRRCNINS